MNWYYAIGQQQQGPVTEPQLHALAKDGVITGDTLVWREGLTNWQPYRTVAAPAMPPLPADARAVIGSATAGRSELEYAGFWIRFCAKLVDGLVLSVPIGILLVIGVVASGGFNRRGSDALVFLPLVQVAVQLVGMALSVLYNAVLVGYWGTTLGKKVCGLKVVKSDGTKPSFGCAWGRAFGEIVSSLVCYIGYIIAGFDAEKRSLHDHMCDTRVVKAR
ncbi:MAG: RDD family protein [Limisphaerales bacterium]